MFPPPPRPCDRYVHIMGEIVSAHAFEYSDLYIRMLVYPPSALSPDSKTEFVTQISHCTKGKAVFSFPFDLLLLLRGPESGTTPEVIVETMPPVLMFQVSSLDHWDRHRTEGYSYTHIPLHAGRHVVSMVTWRPLGDSIIDEMRRFFIGGACELEDMSYIAVPETQHPDAKILSKFGFKTVTSGTIAVTLYVVTQGVPASPPRPTPDLIMPPPSLSTSAVLSAFQRAHARLQMARAGETMTAPTMSLPPLL